MGDNAARMLGACPDLASQRVAARTAARLRRLAAGLSRPRFRHAAPGAGPLLRRLRADLARLPAAERRRLLCGPDLRGFAGEAATWIEARRLAAAAPPGPRGAAARARLFDLISRTEHLLALAPAGRLDPGFAARVRRFALGRLRAAVDDLSAVVAGVRIAWPSPGIVRLALAWREDAEQGRPGDRIDLGTVAGPAGPLGLVAVRPRPARPRPGAAARRPGARLAAEVRGATLLLRGVAGGRRAAAAFPAAGALLRHAGAGPDGAPADRERAGAGPSSRSPWLLVRRPTIPGTPILLGPLVVSRPRLLAVGRHHDWIARRFALALRLVQIAWPEAHRAILRQTAMVVPVREPGTVSWSLAARPGISYINPFGKTIVDLADDLLHETAHHALHDLQEVERLLRRGPEADEVQAFESPWRRAKRPLNGILHGCFTFLHRAALFDRILRCGAGRARLLRPLLGRRGAAWLRRERRRELARVEASLRDLERAARAGLLTPRGARLLRRLRGWRRVLRAPRRRSRGGRAGGRSQDR
jgi:HEXXH motif-containing protein